jgi:peptidoglycan/LPS O-acetylase OafA/YrhL
MPIAWLSWLRWLAMIIIVYYHLHQVRSIDSLALWDWLLYQFSALLPVVVCVFFILGGFLRSLSYWKVIYEWGTTPSFWKWVKDRFSRIAPLYYFVLIASLSWMVYLGIPDWKSFLVGLTFFSWISPDTFFPAAKNWPLWFVAYDMMGNLIVMIVMTWITSTQYTVHSAQSCKVWKIISKLMFAFLLLLSLHFLFISLPFTQSTGIVWEWFPYYNPFIFGIQYLMGAAIWGVYYRFRHIEKSPLGDILFVVSIFAIVYFLLSILGATDIAYSMPQSPFRFPFVPLFFSLAVTALLFARYIPKWLDNKILLFIASISYPLYLTHALIIDMLRHLVFGYAPMVHGKWEIFILVAVSISLLVAWIFMKGEGWMMKKLQK